MKREWKGGAGLASVSWLGLGAYESRHKDRGQAGAWRNALLGFKKGK
jgi:hypothetical protein